MSGFHGFVRVPLDDVAGGGEQFVEHARIGRGPVGVQLVGMEQ